MARKILLADDSVTAQNMGRKILADAGYEVITVNNGSAALKKIAEQKPDLIVLDVYMPGYSGLEVCQRLKEAQETARVPVLLTVGKLEPFKPEEAKRVRADGFIVKPFEASELLSALSKLEDKIVPRGEPSKPGRFARATAAIEEGRYDKTMAVEEDAGWKNRIGFPTKKKEQAAQEEGDEEPIYNAMNKDLRTVVERKPAEQPRQAPVQEARVDLGALAPEGLPKDVTPEEIAALAAAAAQVKGKIADSRESEPAPAETRTEPKLEATQPSQASAEVAREAQAEAAKEAPQPESSQPESQKEVPQEITAAAPAVATFAEQKSEAKSEAKSDAKSEEKSEEKIEAPAAKSSDSPQDAVPSPADVMAAIAGLELDAVASFGAGSGGASSGNGSSSHSAYGRSGDEPVTMAVVAGAELAPAGSRWTAVSVAVAAEEAAISLEHEMQKAYAAFAAAEAGHARLATAPAETQPVSAEPAATQTASPVEAVAPEPSVTVPATPAPEEAQGLSAVANVATDAISAAVKELEAVAASYLAQKTPTAVEPAPVEKADTAAPEAPQSMATSLATSVDESPSATAAEPEMETAKLEAAKSEASNFEAPEIAREIAQEGANRQKDEEPGREELKSEEPKSEELRSEERKTTEEPAQSVSVAETAPEEVTGTAVETPAAAPVAFNDAPEHRTSASTDYSVTPSSVTPSSVTASSVTPAAAPDAPAAAGRGDVGKESEIAANTAAAWASWRRIRESGDSRSAAEEDSAAMAVAAGAEKSPEESSPSESEGIASIVDSVLADMRPKIFEEISRKMGKKK